MSALPAWLLPAITVGILLLLLKGLKSRFGGLEETTQEKKEEVGVEKKTPPSKGPSWFESSKKYYENSEWLKSWWLPVLGYLIINFMILIAFWSTYTTWVMTGWFWQAQSLIVLLAFLYFMLSEKRSHPLFAIGSFILLAWIGVTGFGKISESKTFTSSFGNAKNSVTHFFSKNPEVTTTSWNWENVICVEDALVRKAFPGDTTMWKIARAESNCMQRYSDNRLVRNTKGSSAVGIFQILEGVHGRDCGVEGLDIYTLDGNIKCARILRDSNPITYAAWKKSASKWRDGVQIDTVVIPTAPAVIVSAVERIKIDTVFLTASADQSWSEVVNTEWRPFVISVIGHQKISTQVCSTETDCGEIHARWKGDAPLGRALYIRVRSDSTEATIVQVEVGKTIRN